MIIKSLILEMNDVFEVYRFVANYLANENLIIDANICYNEIVERDLIGCTKVYNDLYLPHIISSNVVESIVVRAKNHTEKFLFILLKEGSEKDRIKGVNIVSKLLRRDFVDEIFLVDNKKFKAILNEI